MGLAAVGWVGTASAVEPGPLQVDANSAVASGASIMIAEGVPFQAGDYARPMNADEPIRLNVVLKMRNKLELRQIAEQVRAGKKASLTEQELAARYLPTSDESRRVYDFLASNGFSKVYISKDHMILTAVGTATNVQSAFKTQVYHLSRGTLSGVANRDPVTIPAALSDVVSAVHGLRSFKERGVSGALAASVTSGVQGMSKASPRTQAASGTVACTECVHAPYDLPSLYGANNLAPASNQVVAVIGVGDQRNTTYLYQQWADNYGFSHTPISLYYPTGYTPGDYEAQTEAVLDVDAVSTMGGSLAGIAFYSAPSTDLGDELTAVAAAVNDNRSVISLSFAATCDADIGQALRDSWDTELSAAVAKNITVFAITQDQGGYPGCSSGRSSTGFPGSSPYVVSVGASTLYNSSNSYSAYDHETLWSGSESGPAATEPRPYYQQGVASIVGSNRGTPDFVMDGDPNTGLWIVTGGYDNTGTYQTQWQVYGGTSLAAPLLAGTYARLLQNGVPPYFWQQTFYNIGQGQVNHTPGHCMNCYNLLTGGSNGAYTVVPGKFNQASGWGSWNAGVLTTRMLYQR
ncbi:S53 family peptidase [Dyella subtropica]|uniref:S53 family peptidase n=1 Tax=Dyella subtropica TaxID=2992127 RepID=UPI002257569D|nr:protease pro-enzyme activation domain-containing protein [Dyella subtropica]